LPKLEYLGCFVINRICMASLEFNKLLLNNADFLKPFAINLTKDSESAKDLFQETLYKALANQEKYNVGTNIKAWLFTIMRNIFINDYRRKAKQRTIFENTSDEYFANLNQGSVANAAESNIRIKEIKQQVIFDHTPNDFLLNYKQPTVINEAEAGLRIKEIYEAVYQLPEIFKTPFLLYFEGYKYHEIAEQLNEPLGTIKSRIHFARKLLKEQISRY